MRVWKDESGQALVVAVLSMSLLLGFLALAVDVGILFRAKRNVQIAADAAATAAALDFKYNQNPGSAKSAANAAAQANGVNGVSVTVAQLNCVPNVNLENCFEATVAVANPTFFMSMFNFGSVTVTASAIAGPGPTENDYLLSGSGANLVSGGAIALANAKLITNSSDPLNLVAPQIPATCQAALTIGSSNPGCYNGISISGGSTVMLTPGLYVINGAINLAASSTLTGNGVTIFFNFNNSPITIDPTATMQLSAPMIGPWNGILFFGASVGTFALRGTSTSSLQGIVYLPNGTLDLGGAGSMQLTTPVVVDQLMDTGTNAITLQDYLPVNTSSPLRTIALLE